MTDIRLQRIRLASYIGAGIVALNGGGIVPTAGIAGTRFQVPSEVASIAANTTSRRHHFAPAAGEVYNIYCVDTSWYINSIPAAGSPRTIKRYVEYPAGTFHQVTWDGGATSKTISTGSYSSDIIVSSVTGQPLRIPAGAKYWERTVNLGALVNSFPVIETPDTPVALGIEDGTVAGDFGNSGTVSAGTTVNTFGAAAMCGMINATNAKGFILYGDSITWGQGDVSGVGAMGGSGFIARTLEALGIPYVKIAKPGWQATNAASSTGSPAAFLARLNYSDFMVLLGINDLRLGRTYTQVKTDCLTVFGLAAAGAKKWQSTVLPRSASTDGFLTVMNQSPKTDGMMADLNTLNADIRLKLAGVDKVLDSADQAMSARDSDVWGGPFPPVLDGTHPATAKAASMAAALSPLLSGML